MEDKIWTMMTREYLIVLYPQIYLTADAKLSPHENKLIDLDLIPQILRKRFASIYKEADEWREYAIVKKENTVITIEQVKSISSILGSESVDRNRLC